MRWMIWPAIWTSTSSRWRAGPRITRKAWPRSWSGASRDSGAAESRRAWCRSIRIRPVFESSLVRHELQGGGPYIGRQMRERADQASEVLQHGAAACEGAMVQPEHVVADSSDIDGIDSRKDIGARRAHKAQPGTERLFTGGSQRLVGRRGIQGDVPGHRTNLIRLAAKYVDVDIRSRHHQFGDRQLG